MLQVLRYVALSLLLTLISGCGSTIGMRWEAVNQADSSSYHSERAKMVSRCRYGSLMSDAPNCEYAVQDRGGRSVKVHDHIIRISDQFLLAKPEFATWVKEEISYGYGSSDTLEQFPYEVHVLTTSPLVLLAVPFDRKTHVCKYDELSRFGCWQSKRLDKLSYSLQFRPPIVSGSFWFMPEQKGSATHKILDTDRELKIPLKGTSLTLSANDGFWEILRK